MDMPVESVLVFFVASMYIALVANFSGPFKPMWTLAVPTRNPYVYVGLLFVGMRIAALSTMVQHAVDAMKAKRANEGPPMIYVCV